MHHTPMAQETSSQQPHAPFQEQIVSVFHTLLAQALPLSSPAQPKRGRPPRLHAHHLWLSFLLSIFQSSGSFRDLFRSLTVEAVGTFPAIKMTYEGVRKRLLSLGAGALRDLFEHLSLALAARDRPPARSALPLAPFASEIVALDETTLDKIKRLTPETKDLAVKDPHLLAGKLAGLFDLRRQQWRCLQWRTDVLAGCNIGVLDLLEGLPPASLILADLGYFSFRWFDYLTSKGYYYVSRLRENGTYEIQHLFYQDTHHQVLDALVWLGAHRSDKAAYAVRLVQFEMRGKTYQYLTNVLDPLELPLLEIAQLYARRWDIELMFKLLKRDLGIHLWWGAKQELIEMQIWLALILAQILCALRFDLAEQAEVELFDVSLGLLIKVLGRIKDPSQPLLQKLVEHGRDWGVIRPNRRNKILVPALKPGKYHPLPEDTPLIRPARYAQRNPHPRKKAFLPLYQDRFIIEP